MFVVINIDPGSTLNELMTFMTQKTITFSVTDHISKLCDKNVIGERRECSTQTDVVVEPDNSYDAPPAKKSRSNNDECASPCSSATPSEPTDTEKTNQWDADVMILRHMIEKSAGIKSEIEPTTDDDVSQDFMQTQLMQALISKIKTEGGEIEMDDPDLDSINFGDLTATTTSCSPAPAIRFKSSYASTKRGVCQVCNREVSLITTHRKRHAITHLGFKTLKCAICHKFFSRQDLASGHFKKDHVGIEFVPFVDTMSPEDEKQLAIMMSLCFPDENTPRKRSNKDGSEAKTSVRQETS